MNDPATSLEDRARLLFQAGRLDEALAHYRQLCQSSPDNPQAWHMASAIAGMQGKYTEAEKYCERVISLRPDAPGGYQNLATILMATGRHEAALARFREALALSPEDPQILTSLANLYIARAQHREARAHLDKALQSDPDHAEALNGLGIVQNAAGELDKAEASLRRAIELRPGYVDALCNLGAVLNNRLEYKAAEDCYRQALHIDPGNHQALRNYGNLYQSTGEFGKARECYRQSLARDGGDPETLSSMASLLERCGETDAARACLQPLIESGRLTPQAAITYAAICRRNHCRDQAIELLEPFAGPEIGLSDRVNALFALGELHDSAGRYDQAFEYFRAGNELDHHGFSPDRYLDYFDRLRRFFSPERLPHLPRSTCGSTLPVFIVGMPRSGTSLVEQILASHPDVHAGGERSDISNMTDSLQKLSGLEGPYPDLLDTADHATMDRLAAHYLDLIRTPSAGCRRFTDKTPFHAMHLGFINLLLPAARVIVCRRDPRDTCLSIYFHRFNAYHDYASSLAGLGVFHRLYSALLDYWISTLDIKIMEVQYEELVANSDAEIYRLTDFCGLERNPACLSFHRNPRTLNTPSYDQVRQPMYSSSVNRWKHYVRHLEPLQRALAGDER